MSEHHPTLEYPYSADPDTLIICKDEKQIRQAQAVFHYDARYVTWYTPLCGSRYKNIVVFRTNYFDSDVIGSDFEEQLKTHWPTKLRLGGGMLVIDC